MVSETNCYVNAPVTHHWFVRSHPNGSSDRTPMVHGSHKHVQNRRPVALSWFKFTPKSPSRGSNSHRSRPLVVHLSPYPPSLSLPVQLALSWFKFDTNRRKSHSTGSPQQVSLYRFSSKTLPMDTTSGKLWILRHFWISYQNCRKSHSTGSPPKRYP